MFKCICIFFLNLCNQKALENGGQDVTSPTSPVSPVESSPAVPAAPPTPTSPGMNTSVSTGVPNALL